MRLAWNGLIPIGLALVALAVFLVYTGRAVSIWATIGNIVLWAVVTASVALRKTEVTGRQRYLPPIRSIPSRR
jgi:hypothetical protein